MRYKYFVTFYKGKTEESKTFGQTVLETTSPVTAVKEVKKIEKYLEKEIGVKVAVIGFSKFEEVQDVSCIN